MVTSRWGQQWKNGTGTGGAHPSCYQKTMEGAEGRYLDPQENSFFALNTGEMNRKRVNLLGQSLGIGGTGGKRVNTKPRAVHG